MITRYPLSLSAVALAAVALTAAAPASAKDAVIEQRLEKEGLKYEVDGDGDYKLVFNFNDEGRTQLAFVSGGTQSVGGMTIREVFAPAARVGEGGVNASQALALMKDSSTNKVGSWEIRGDVLYFVIKVFDNMSATQLGSLLKIAAESADNKEIELTGGQDAL